MQATVHRFDPDTSAGEVLLDSGVTLPFTADVFAASGLLQLRLGQRLSIELNSTAIKGDSGNDQHHVTRLWIVGIGEGEVIR